MIISMKSRMKGDFHVRFCGNVGVKFTYAIRFSRKQEIREATKVQEMIVK